VQLLDEAGLLYVVMYRDLRDVAASYFFYVKRTRWHPDRLAHRELDAKGGLLRFGRTPLPAYVTWIRQWRSQRDLDWSMIVRCEDYLKDTKSVFWAPTALYDLDAEHSENSEMVDAHCFDQTSGERDRGNQDMSIFLSKGVSGDWKQHFTPPVT
jgi:hypothetical protein